ncbi:AraC family ligand binding domain-containing protein [Paenibacillus endoradicis]|uniref:AraC family ligand binding domain-containing protein n=1 Tax=Paenibacillus endoradicis TaxID=2972487 RepID=UPI0021592ACE|nr:AraC family ligand binding domain-containing protein [Paenibacillus endoradicis]MCR8659569.1 AraC family ligand binding domain-containing protein [Paenibacillus endoradicis]
MYSDIVHFVSPPIPCFIDCGRAFYQIGEGHIHRKHIGVFDLIVVTKGELSILECERVWNIKPGEALVLRPDAEHQGANACDQVTEMIWIHFHTFGS